MWPNLQKTAELVRFTEKILNGKLQFCAVALNGTTICIQWKVSKNGSISNMVFKHGI